jgi:aspartyl protease family protein
MRFYSISIALVVLTFSPPSLSAADLFRWVDERGVVHFTDNPHNIPEKHKNSATRIQARETPPSQQPPKPIFLDKATIPLQRKGQVVIVQGTVNEKATANFVVDTGASYTMISRSMAKQLDLDMEKKLPTVPFQTANGVIQAPLVTLESIDIGGMQVKDLTAAVHDVFPDPNITGLLGLNFLGNFRMDIDTEKGLLVLEKK